MERETKRGTEAHGMYVDTRARGRSGYAAFAAWVGNGAAP